jgi:acyl-CoA synthetase (NDP forming)
MIVNQRPDGTVDEDRTVLTEIESKRFLESAGIPVVETELAVTRDAVVYHAEQIGFPMAMKIISPDIIHKTDAGGVRLNVRTIPEAEQAYDDIIRNALHYNPAARVYGVSVQKMTSPGQEVIIGMSRDPQFGPLLMFGLGGIMVEILKDVSFRLAPLTHRDAQEMIKEIKGYRLLTGFRGTEPVDIARLEALLLAVSDLVEAHPEIKELDLNPIVVNKDGALVVDGRIILENRA